MGNDNNKNNNNNKLRRRLQGDPYSPSRSSNKRNKSCCSVRRYSNNNEELITTTPTTNITKEVPVLVSLPKLSSPHAYLNQLLLSNGYPLPIPSTVCASSSSSSLLWLHSECAKNFLPCFQTIELIVKEKGITCFYSMMQKKNGASWVLPLAQVPQNLWGNYIVFLYSIRQILFQSLAAAQQQQQQQQHENLLLVKQQQQQQQQNRNVTTNIIQSVDQCSFHSSNIIETNRNTHTTNENNDDDDNCSIGSSISSLSDDFNDDYDDFSDDEDYDDVDIDDNEMLRILNMISPKRRMSFEYKCIGI